MQGGGKGGGGKGGGGKGIAALQVVLGEHMPPELLGQMAELQRQVELARMARVDYESDVMRTIDPLREYVARLEGMLVLADTVILGLGAGG